MNGALLAIGSLAGLSLLTHKNRTRGSRDLQPTDYDDLRIFRGFLLGPEGRIPIKKIGEGSFATAYKRLDGSAEVFVVLDDSIPDKEILAEAHAQNPENPHLPAVVRYGSLTGDQTVWRMPLYQSPLKKANSERAWKAYRVLQKCLEDATNSVGTQTGFRDMTWNGYRINDTTVTCSEDKRLAPLLLEAVASLRDTAANYRSSLLFEFYPRNLATDAAGNLVLLDPIYDAEQLARVRRQAREKARPYPRDPNFDPFRWR